MDQRAGSDHFPFSIPGKPSGGKGCLFSVLAFIAVSIIAGFLVDAMNTIPWHVVFGSGWTDTTIAWIAGVALSGVLIFVAAIFVRSNWWTVIATLPFLLLTLLLFLFRGDGGEEWFGNSWLFTLSASGINLAATLLGYRYADLVERRRTVHPATQPSEIEIPLEW